MPAVANLNQICVGICCAHGTPPCINTTGVIASGAATVTAEGLPVARVGDLVVLACGHTAIIVSGSPTVTAEGIPLARATDLVGGVFTGNIATGTPTVQSN